MVFVGAFVEYCPVDNGGVYDVARGTISNLELALVKLVALETMVVELMSLVEKATNLVLALVEWMALKSMLLVETATDTVVLVAVVALVELMTMESSLLVGTVANWFWWRWWPW